MEAWEDFSIFHYLMPVSTTSVTNLREPLEPGVFLIQEEGPHMPSYLFRPLHSKPSLINSVLPRSDTLKVWERVKS